MQITESDQGEMQAVASHLAEAAGRLSNPAVAAALEIMSSDVLEMMHSARVVATPSS